MLTHDRYANSMLHKMDNQVDGITIWKQMVAARPQQAINRQPARWYHYSKTNVCLLGDIFNSKKSTPKVILTVLPVSIVIFTCGFPMGILGQVWYLIGSIPDLCNLTYF